MSKIKMYQNAIDALLELEEFEDTKTLLPLLKRFEHKIQQAKFQDQQLQKIIIDIEKSFKY